MAKNKVMKVGIFLLLIFGITSCKTYYIPVASFKKQFENIDTTNYRIVNARGPMGDIVEYLANPIDFIKCLDKNGNPTELKNSPSIEIRFTEMNNKRTVYYFDRVFLQDTLIIGDMSRFIILSKEISINNVIKIEVQDGHKNFKYVDK